MANENGPKDPKTEHAQPISHDEIPVEHEAVNEAIAIPEKDDVDIATMSIADMEKELQALQVELQMLGTAQIGDRQGVVLATNLQRIAHEQRCAELEGAIIAHRKKQN